MFYVCDDYRDLNQYHPGEDFKVIDNDAEPNHYYKIGINFINVMGNDSNGKIDEKTFRDQILVLNECFKYSRIHFVLNRIVESVNEIWFNWDPIHRSNDERDMKNRLGAHHEEGLNFYTVNSYSLDDESMIIGKATFPRDYYRSDNPQQDGIVVAYNTLPGLNDLFKGKNAVHEVGHWMGLYHTFQGGCNQYGDLVPDTVAHKRWNTGSADRITDPNNACNPSEKPPIRNYMNYTDDSVRNEFTEQQIRRMRYQLLSYRTGQYKLESSETK